MKFCCSASTMQRRNRSSRLSFCAVAARCSNSFLAASVAQASRLDQEVQKKGEKPLIFAKVSNQIKLRSIYSTSFLQFSQKGEISNIRSAHILDLKHKMSTQTPTSRSRSCRKSISACSSSCPFTPHLHQKSRSFATPNENPQAPPHLRAAPMASANWEASPRFKALRRAETFRKVTTGGLAFEWWRNRLGSLYLFTIHSYFLALSIFQEEKYPKVQTLVFVSACCVFSYPNFPDRLAKLIRCLFSGPCTLSICIPRSCWFLLPGGFVPPQSCTPEVVPVLHLKSSASSVKKWMWCTPPKTDIFPEKEPF